VCFLDNEMINYNKIDKKRIEQLNKQWLNNPISNKKENVKIIDKVTAINNKYR